MPQTISSGMTAALKSPRQKPVSKVEILDGVTRNLITTITGVDEGSVTVDVSRGTRRTFQLRLSNKNGEFTPTSSADNFSFGRLVRIYRGLRFYDETLGETVDEYVTLGTFMVDRPEVFVEKGMSVITIDGSDLWKKIATGGFADGFSFAAGTHINTIISKVAELSGIAFAHMSLDPLTGSRTSDGYTTGAIVAWEPGDSRADFLMNMTKQWGIQLYFNPDGILVSSEIPDPTSASPAWTFIVGQDSILLGVTKTQTDLRLINHIVVTGESSNGIPSNSRYEIVDSNPLSPTYTGLIGDRVMVYPSPQVFTNTQAMHVALKLYAENSLIDEELKIPLICLPHLEGNDVIQVVEPLAKVSDKYLCLRFDIPLRESRMTIDSKKGRAVA